MILETLDKFDVLILEQLQADARLTNAELAASVDLILVARASIVGKHYADVERDYLGALKKARLYREEAGSVDSKTS